MCAIVLAETAKFYCDNNSAYRNDGIKTIHHFAPSDICINGVTILTESVCLPNDDRIAKNANKESM